MAIIKTIKPEDATGKVKEIYSMFNQRMGMVPSGIQLFSASPEILEAQAGFMAVSMAQKKFSPALLAFIRILVSVEHKCQYCIDVNVGMLMNSGMSKEAIDASIADPNKTPLDEKEKAILLFVLKSVKEPLSIDSSQIEKLRTLGWDDKDIFEAVYFGALEITIDIIFNTFKV